ncbi:MAG: response regulator [Oscillospiraceae bacterium]|nr:response regulator [Oscillospiraceae bacterium]
MKTILVDDQLWNMLQFKAECEDIPEIELVGEFESAKDALAYARGHLVEFALLDIEMPGVSGIELARQLREIYPDVIIVFLTGHKQYLEEFINLKADYYVFKPYTKSDVMDVIKRAKLLSGRLKKRVSIRTLGRFDVFVDGRPLYFKSAKAKELLALLVDKRGAILTAREALDTVWADKNYGRDDTSVYRVTMLRLRETLEQEGAANILCSTVQGKYLDTALVDCDLYALLDGQKWELFHGEYMSDYSWAERTLAALEDGWRKHRKLR